MGTLYSYRAADELISTMFERSYECINLREGVLGSGDWVLIAPDEEHYNFVIREVVLNEWSSAHTIRRCKKLSQKILKEIKEVTENGN